jgi:tetratricopeptide (TPR) repeat protein
MRASIGLTVLLALTVPRVLRAQDGSGWIGERVVLQFWSVLRVGHQVVDNQTLEATSRGGLRGAFRIYKVEQVNGPWLWLKGENERVAGWILAAEVIPYDQAIDYYTNQIRANPSNVEAYLSRGHIWRGREEYDLALADYNGALCVNPGSEVCWCARGNAWYDKKQHDKAIAATRIDPKLLWPYFNRAAVCLIRRQKGVTESVKRVLELEKGKGEDSAYAVILGWLAARVDKDDSRAKEFLGPLAATLNASQWPYPIVRYLRGELDEAGLLAQASDDDKRTDAHCYLGLDLLVKGQREGAIEHLRWVKDHGNSTFAEHAVASAELDRLGAGPVATREGTTTRQAAQPAPVRPDTATKR